MTHDCWHGAYGAFHHWRCEIAKILGIPFEFMEGFYSKEGFGTLRMWAGPNAFDKEQRDRWERWLPIAWKALRPDPLHVLLRHSDCDGYIGPNNCREIARRLRQILSSMPVGDAGGHIGNWHDTTKKFIDGLELAASRNERVEFG